LKEFSTTDIKDVYNKLFTCFGKLTAALYGFRFRKTVGSDAWKRSCKASFMSYRL